MMHKIATSLSDLLIEAEWISPRRREWCIYTLETKLQSVLFLLFAISISVALNAVNQALIFLLCFSLLRRRFGGWHAPSAALCELLSLSLVLFNILCLGPALSLIPGYLIRLLSICLLIICLITKPAFPAQVHFSSADIKANNTRKNILVSLAFLLQITTSRVAESILIFSMLAEISCVLLVFMEKKAQKHLL